MMFIPNPNVYATPKMVQIHDWRLGILKYIMQLAIFIYIVPYSVMYAGKHLADAQVNGVVKVFLREPTRKGCDAFQVGCVPHFDKLADLPYCKQNNYSGVYQKLCEYRDQVDLRQHLSDEGILIPTHILTYNQRRVCDSTQTSCAGRIFEFLDSTGKVQNKSQPEPTPVREIFVADVEKYKILFDHSAHSDAGVMQYSFQMPGYWLNCSSGNGRTCTSERILCVHAKCPPGSLTSRNMEQALGITPTQDVSLVETDAQETTDVDSANSKFIWTQSSPHGTPKSLMEGAMQFSSNPSSNPSNEYKIVQSFLKDQLAVAAYSGDIFSINQLLNVANAPLDGKVPHGVNGTDETYRSDGLSLVVRLYYSNVEPWMGFRVTPWNHNGSGLHYTYHISQHTTGQHALRKIMYSSKDKNFRTVEEFRGIRLVLQQTGAIKVWDTMHTLIILTTTLALLALSTFILDCVALHCLEKRNIDELNLRKFEKYGSTEAMDQC